MKNLVTVTAVAAIIFVVGCSPREPETDALPPFVGLANGSFSANLNGFDIHYEIRGQGPVLMVVPQSWGLSIAGLRAIYKPLEERLTLVYFDPRGMGGSAAIVEDADMGLAAVRADFNALREHLGFESIDAIGWSNGAMNLILLAAENPATIKNAIFVHGVASYTEEDGAAWATRYPELMAKYLAFEKEMRTNTDLTDADRTERMRWLWFEDWFPLSTADPDNAPLMFERLFGDAEFSWAHADYNNRASPTFDARDQLPRITARSLVIAGAHDMMSVDMVQELADGITDAQFMEFEFSGHFAPAEETDAFVKSVWDFLGID